MNNYEIHGRAIHFTALVVENFQLNSLAESAEKQSVGNGPPKKANLPSRLLIDFTDHLGVGGDGGARRFLLEIINVGCFFYKRQTKAYTFAYIPKDEICTRLRVMNIKLAGWIFVRCVEMKTGADVQTCGTFQSCDGDSKFSKCHKKCLLAANC